jgi:peptidoglycan/xylan/chitin deacetylase (PgdA/CDA1 family)
MISDFRKKVNRKLRATARRWMVNMLHAFGITLPWVKKARGLKILIYHGVTDQNPFTCNSRFISAQAFERQLTLYKEHFHLLSFDDYKAGKIATGRLNVMLTFDDGLKNNFRHVLPLLKKHRVPAVFFVTPPKPAFLFNDLMDVLPLVGPSKITVNGTTFKKVIRYGILRYADSSGELMQSLFHARPPGERERIMDEVIRTTDQAAFSKYADFLELMSAEELRTLASTPGITIGSHSATHASLSSLSDDDLCNELDCNKAIAEATGRPCDILAFPYGEYDDRVCAFAKNAGYTHLFGTERINRPADREHVIERFTINPYISAINLVNYIALGHYE